MRDRVTLSHNGTVVEVTGTLGDIMLALVNDPNVRLALETAYCGEIQVHYSPAEVEIFNRRKLTRIKRQGVVKAVAVAVLMLCAGLASAWSADGAKFQPTGVSGDCSKVNYEDGGHLYSVMSCPATGDPSFRVNAWQGNSNTLACTFSVRANTTDSAKTSCFRHGGEVNTAGAKLDDLTGGAAYSATVTGPFTTTADETVVIAAPAAFTVYDGNTGIACASTTCQNRMIVVEFERVTTGCTDNLNAAVEVLGVKCD